LIVSEFELGFGTVVISSLAHRSIDYQEGLSHPLLAHRGLD
jgi:hypothetical protein